LGSNGVRHPFRPELETLDYERLVSSPARMRQKHGVAIATWVFLPDHWHAIIYSPLPFTIPTVFEAVKVNSMIGINVRRSERGELWQDRSFDRALRTVKEYNEGVESIHLNPVRRDLAGDTRDWKWSGVQEYAGVSGEEQERRCSLRIDRVRLRYPAL